MLGDFHVVPRNAGWAVRREGTANDFSFHLNQREALSVARQLATRERTEVIRYSKGGEVREIDQAWDELRSQNEAAPG